MSVMRGNADKTCQKTLLYILMPAEGSGARRSCATSPLPASKAPIRGSQAMKLLIAANHMTPVRARFT